MKFKGRLTYRNFLDYFSNKLEKKEKHAFEKQMMQDSFESEAFDGLSKLDVTDFEKDMADLDILIQDRVKDKKRRILVWFPYAASVSILLILSSVLYYLNQYSSQEEMIGSQMEDLVPKVEKSIAEPEIIKQDSESVDIMDMIEADLEMEISDADEEVEDVELSMVLEEEEENKEIVPIVKSKEISTVQAVEKIAFVDKTLKVKKEVSEESMQRVLKRQVAGVEVQKLSRQKSAKKSIVDNTLKSSRIISGKVVDEDKIPIPGVNVVVKGTRNGVVTDLDGQFKLDASDISQDYKLVASFIGFETKELNAQADSSLLVVLEMTQDDISEVVATGYGTSKTERGNTHWHEAKPKQFSSISKFEDDLIENLESKKFKHLQGIRKVKFTFIVESNGAINSIKFKGNPDAILAKEIEHLLFDTGDWYPAESSGEAVDSKVRMVLKIDFK